MKTYFNYESTIRSGEAAEAIASPIGIGPFCGFGSAEYSNVTLTIYPTGLDGTFTQLPIADRIRARYMGKTQDENSNTRFGVIAADGTIYTDYQETIEISEIQGSQGTNDNILVYAVHVQVTEPVENPVTFVAYWNSSSTNFFELYKRSMDPYYPRTSSTDNYLENIDPYSDEELNYSYLCELAKAACPSGQINDETMVLVGIYGSGINAETNLTEEFAIVPYNGQFPQPLPYNTAVYGAQQAQISNLQTMLSSLPTDTSLLDYIKDYINSLIGSSSSSTSILGDTIPSGTIVMYYGTSAPDGWAICDGSNNTPDLRGKFVIGVGADGNYGLGSTGGSETATLSLNNMVDHVHLINDYALVESGAASGSYWDGSVYLGSTTTVGDGKKDSDNKYAWYMNHDSLHMKDTDGTEHSGTTEPFSILPPYCALNYIMKL